MSEITAVVKRLEENHVWVETDPASSCSRCKGGSGCSSVSISRLFCSSKQQFRVSNTLSLQEGDVVTIGLPDEVMLKTALIAYGFPLLCLLIGAVVGAWAVPANPDLASIALGALGFVIGLISLRFLETNRGDNTSIQPSVLAKISGPVIALTSH